MRTVDGTNTRLTADRVTWNDLDPGTTLVAVDGVRFGKPYEGYADHLTTLVLQPTGLVVEGMRHVADDTGGGSMLALTVWMGPVMVELTFTDETVLTLEHEEQPTTGPDSTPTGYSGVHVTTGNPPSLHTLLQQRDPRDW